MSGAVLMEPSSHSGAIGNSWKVVLLTSLDGSSVWRTTGRQTGVRMEKASISGTDTGKAAEAAQ
ncbi:hypothetical protein GCM10009594_25060 [Kocuria palustris]